MNKTKPPTTGFWDRILPSSQRHNTIQTDEQFTTALATVEANNPVLTALVEVLHLRCIGWADEAADMTKGNEYRLRAMDRFVENKQVIDEIELLRANAKVWRDKVEEQKRNNAK